MLINIHLLYVIKMFLAEFLITSIVIIAFEFRKFNICTSNTIAALKRF